MCFLNEFHTSLLDKSGICVKYCLSDFDEAYRRIKEGECEEFFFLKLWTNSTGTEMSVLWLVVIILEQCLILGKKCFNSRAFMFMEGLAYLIKM